MSRDGKPQDPWLQRFNVRLDNTTAMLKVNGAILADTTATLKVNGAILADTNATLKQLMSAVDNMAHQQRHRSRLQ
jgi:hypothetical protein